MWDIVEHTHPGEDSRESLCRDPGEKAKKLTLDPETLGNQIKIRYRFKFTIVMEVENFKVIGYVRQKEKLMNCESIVFVCVCALFDIFV